MHGPALTRKDIELQNWFNENPENQCHFDISKTDVYLDSLKRFLEKTVPIHQFHTYTFGKPIGHDAALKAVESFLLKRVARPQKVHIFLPYFQDWQPNRTGQYSHIHAYPSFERFSRSQIGDSALELLWNDIGRGGDLKIRQYDSNLSGVKYGAEGHEHWGFKIICPRHQHRCNGRGRECWFEKNPHEILHSNR